MDMNLLIRETALPADTVRTRWKLLNGLPLEDRSLLDPAKLNDLWQTELRDTLDFLWACVRAGGLTARWQVYNPATGWVLEEEDSPRGLRGRPLTDPFVEDSSILPDLGVNTRVVFTAYYDAYAGSWAEYARFRQLHSTEAPFQTRVLKGWEVGKLELNVEEDEVYHLVCLETQSFLTLTVDSAKVTGGRSFIGKMKQYRAQKFLLSLQRRVIDLQITQEGFVTDQAMVAPGNLMYWLENKTARPVVVQVWKTILPKPVAQAADDKTLLNLGLPAFRRYWSTLALDENFRQQASGLSFLSLDFSLWEDLFPDGDAKWHDTLWKVFQRVRASVAARQGFLSDQGPLGLTAAFFSASVALGAALELRQGFAGQSTASVPVMTLTTSPGLLVNLDRTPVIFGSHLPWARKCQAHSRQGDLWISEGIWTAEGVQARLGRDGLQAKAEKTLGYRVALSPANPA